MQLAPRHHPTVTIFVVELMDFFFLLGQRWLSPHTTLGLPPRGSLGGQGPEVQAHICHDLEGRPVTDHLLCRPTVPSDQYSLALTLLWLDFGWRG